MVLDCFFENVDAFYCAPEFLGVGLKVLQLV